MGDFTEACRAAERALGLDRQAGYRYGEGIALNVLGCARRELGQSADAIVHLQQALAIFREINAPDPEADSLSELGETYLRLGQLSDSIACLRKALTHERDGVNRHHQAANLQRLGRAWRAAGDMKLAREHFAEALQLYEELMEASQATEIRADLGSLVEEGG